MRFAYAVALVATPCLALDDPQTPLQDPYRTGMLGYHQVEMLGDPARIALDPRVRVTAPSHALDSLQVPAMIDATAVEGVVRIVAFVDYGPIPKILEFRPGAAEPKLAFSFKIDQATPLRAAVELEDGSWLIGGTQIDAMGGGCSAPAEAYASDDWEERLMQVHARMWPDTGRLVAQIDHPMDTGLSFSGTPAFYIEELTFTAQSGAELARIEVFEPVSEDPRFTLFAPPHLATAPVRMAGRDTDGYTVTADIAPSGLTQ